MADILLVDSNPEHIRSLSGIIRYRTRNELNVVSDCVQALRRIHSRPPDLILINVLLYCSEDFGFARALAESREHGAIPVATHLSGNVGDLTRRRIEARGARLLELPISADEIEEELHRPVKVSGVETVSWAQAAPATSAQEHPKKAPVSETSGDAQTVRSVNWAVDGGSAETNESKESFRAKARPQAARATERKTTPPQPDPKPPAPASGGFAPLANSAERVEEPSEFVSGRHFEKVDPKEVKNRSKSGRRS